MTAPVLLEENMEIIEYHKNQVLVLFKMNRLLNRNNHTISGTLIE